MDAALNDNKVALGFLIDRSGSMDAMNPNKICDSLNTTIKDQLATNKDIRVWVATFDDKYKLVHRNVDAKNITILPKHIEPRGMTALYDGMKCFMNDLGDSLREMNDRPAKVIVVILTDGEENASKRTLRTEVMRMVTHQKRVYSWEFVFLGANQDAILNGEGLGIEQSSACDFDYSADGCAAVLRTTSAAINRTITGQTPTFEFTNDERLESQCINLDSNYKDITVDSNDDFEESQYMQ